MNPNITIDIKNKEADATLATATKLEGTFTPTGPTQVALVPAGSAEPTDDQVLWATIRNRASAASFPNFEKFIDIIFCQAPPNNSGDNPKTRATINAAVLGRVGSPCYHGSEAYNLLKASAEVFLALQCGIKVEPPLNDDGSSVANIPGEAGRGTTLDTFESLKTALTKFLTNFLTGGSRLYLETILNALKEDDAISPLCAGILRPKADTTDGNSKNKFDCYPCMLELIWSYWHEEGMLVQTLNALC
ncbi:MAG TPA: hypothetical protein VK678_08970, partial [Bradyrhizobium sp.]|nr:hypothetical protein [Bradyrhizobium sp.]